MSDSFWKQCGWSRVIVAMAAVGVFVITWRASSNDRLATDAPHRIPLALVDVGRVFKSYPEFSRRMEELKREFDQANKQMSSQLSELQSFQKKVQESAGTSASA